LRLERAAPRFNSVSPLKVIYIAGWGRSGSTLLDDTLGQIDGWFACGEVSLIWHDVLCRCDALPAKCEFWGPVLRETLARHPEHEPTSLRALQGRWLDRNPSRLLTIAREARRNGLGGGHPLRVYARVLADLYEISAEAAGASVLVDSSKGAPLAYLAAKLTGSEVYLVHLVRDPRACAHSVSKKKLKRTDPPRFHGRMGPVASSLGWLGRNAIIETLIRWEQGDRYLRLRYEDFADRPRGAVHAICAMVDEAPASLPFLDESSVADRANHSIAGNPPTVADGVVRIRRDDQWRTRMSARSRRLATLAAAPLMPHYGYPLLPRGGG
jgi:hypothetical protein